MKLTGQLSAVARPSFEASESMRKQLALVH